MPSLPTSGRDPNSEKLSLLEYPEHEPRTHWSARSTNTQQDRDSMQNQNFKNFNNLLVWFSSKIFT